ncbi:hypothetical protein [Stenotrophomonas sp. AB1(2024)]|jgi:hypothetical protein|uniref:hypothetical protein n=1 Tax=Stenotrophomonas sp. AB1(2024) TaxID=3132215 RepID=UPI00309C1399
MNTTVAADIDRTAKADTCLHPPNAPEGAPDGWWIREFQEDGIDHIEVRDDTGCVNVAIAYAAGVFWALQAGYPSARVSLPNWRLKLPDGANPTVVYTSPVFSLIRFSRDEDVVWWIQPSTAAR